MTTEGGRPRKPTALKVLHGDRADRMPGGEPQPAAGDPAPPFVLTKAAREVWDRLAPDLHAKGVLTSWDVDAFAEFCEAVTILRSKRRSARRRAQPGESSPMAEYRAAMQVVTTLGSRFGLTPADRAKLSVPASEDDSSDDLLSKGSGDGNRAG